MRALRDAYSVANHINKSLYLFMFAGGDTENKLQGDMPLKSKFGYSFNAKESSAESTARTIAHELGHGFFELRHTFSKKYNVKQGTTDNLMDYNNGNQLIKYQWDVLFDPQKRLFNWAQSEGEGQMSILELRRILRDLRLCKKHNIAISSTKNKSGELEKGSYLFEYKTKDKITLFYKKNGSFNNFSFYESKEYSNWYHRDMYQIKIGDFGFINCFSEEDRDVVYDFVIAQNRDKYMLTNTVSIKNKKTYSYELLYNNLENIKANLIKKNKYNILSESERLLLDLPLIMWSKKWEYGAIFMYNWFMEEGDIYMDDELYSFLDKWEALKILRKKFSDFIDKNKNKKIGTKDNVIKEGGFRLYKLNDLRKWLKLNSKDTISTTHDFSDTILNFSRLSRKLNYASHINNPYVASFGSFGLGFLFEGNYDSQKKEIQIVSILENIDDSFDFEGFQPLGGWINSIFKKDVKVDKVNVNYFDNILNVRNKTFRDFREKTGVGKDFRIKGKRLNKDKFIDTIKIDKDYVEYK